MRFKRLLLGTALLATVGALAAETVGLVAARFALTIDGREIASFTELESLTSVATLPGNTKYGEVVLKRGLPPSFEMSAWHELALQGDVAAARKSVSLVMYGNKGEPVSRYHLVNAWPSKLEIGALKAGASEVLMETVTLSTEHIQRVVP